MGGSAFINLVEYPEFDNFYQCQIEYEGMIFNSSESLYQALKFRDKDYRLAISKASTGVAYVMGQSRRYQPVKGYPDNRGDLMKIANTKKILQNINLQKLLINSNGTIIFKNGSRFWNKENAKILTDIRNEFLQAKSNSYRTQISSSCIIIMKRRKKNYSSSDEDEDGNKNEK